MKSREGVRQRQKQKQCLRPSPWLIEPSLVGGSYFLRACEYACFESANGGGAYNCSFWNVAEEEECKQELKTRDKIRNWWANRL